MAGLSLIELMVALVISMFIMIGLVQVFSTNRASYQVDEGLARQQENARFALEFIGREVRAAGNMGCLAAPDMPPDWKRGRDGLWDGQKVKNFLVGADSVFDVSATIQGFDAGGPTAGGTYTLPALYPPATTTVTTPALDAALLNTPIVTGSDVLVTRAISDDAIALAAPNFHDGTTLFVTKPNNIKDDQIVVLGGCDYVAIFRARVTPGGAFDSVTHPAGAGNLCEDWYNGCGMELNQNTFRFREGATIGTVRTVVLYVGQGAGNGPSLFRRVFSDGGIARDEELVEGIENLQVSYGVDTDDDPDRTADRYLLPIELPLILNKATNTLVTNWGLVRSVRVGLLVATSNVSGGIDTAYDTSQYVMPSQNITFLPNADNRRRRVFEATFESRNYNRGVAK
jgi:type IV pilus assembly protein PilW